jgi:IS6 family transposase
MKRKGALWRFAKLRQSKLLSNILKRGHSRIKRVTRPGQGVKGFLSASRTIAGNEIMTMIRMGQVVSAPAGDLQGPERFDYYTEGCCLGWFRLPATVINCRV